MSSIVRSLLQRLTFSRGYVGRDLQGNKFYEHPPAQPGSTRTKRRVKYARLGDAYSYATGLSRLPAQWAAWLSHTRLQPPTTEELKADLARQRRITVLAAQIQARDDGERERQIAATKPDSLQGTLGVSPQTALPHDSAPQELRAEAQRRTRLEEPQDARIPSQSPGEPQSWAPGSFRSRHA